MITITNLHKQFASLEVLKGISLNVEKGKVVVIIGPSGSGKTTLLRCLNALEIPTNGSVQIGEVKLDFSQKVERSSIPRLRKQTGMVFQSYNLFPHMTVLENVCYGPISMRVDKTRARELALAKLDMLGLAGLGYAVSAGLA